MLIKIDSQLENFAKIYGCYINAGQIVSRMTLSVLDMTDEEKEMYSKIFKKCISGKYEKNLLAIDIENDLPKRLTTSFEDTQNEFFTSIIKSLDLDKNYCILLVNGVYETEEETEPYFLCAICPIKDSKAQLRYNSEKEFRGDSTGSVLGSPVIGINYPLLFKEPDRSKATYFFAKDKHEELITLFGTAPESAEEAKNRLINALAEFDPIETPAVVNAELAAEEVITTDKISEVLHKHSYPEEKILEFEENIGDFRFKRDGIIDSNITIKTTGATITAQPDKITTRVIDGEEYILVPASDVISINKVELK